MELLRTTLKFLFRVATIRSLLVLITTFAGGWLGAPTAQGQGQTNDARRVVVLAVQGEVHLVRGNDPSKYPARTNDVLNSGDRLSTGPKSQAKLLWYDRSVLQVDQLSLVEIPPTTPQRRPIGFRLLQGLIYFFHRDAPDAVEFNTPRISAVVKGTEFSLRVATDGTTTVSVFEGEVEMKDPAGAARKVGRNEQGIAREGSPLEVRPMIEAANDLLQWFLYYPGVLDPAEIPFTDAQRTELADSLQGYAEGDLATAFARFPSSNPALSPEQELYHAALLLSVGQVEEADQRLTKLIPRQSPEARLTVLAQALRSLVQVVKGRAAAADLSAPQFTTELLVRSYQRQAAGRLDEALAAARRATEVSPRFGFAWARVAELEFGHGRIPESERALGTALSLSPKQAEALSLRGFLLGAKNRIVPAIAAFSEAIARDPRLGNAWLGRGLCRIRLGQRTAGLADLLTAASTEPQRASLRSYLGKAYAEAGVTARAYHELELATQLDPRDPTAFLYRALLQQQQNRVNEAIEDLEHSETLNANRQIYRSKVLLDQDRAVAGANLATVYSDVGMQPFSLQQASRAVSADYANFSSHLFLANSYNELRDPRQIDLRYETPWQSEYLVSQLIAPVGGGTLSPYVTHQEYSRFFERDRLGFSSRSDYLSDGNWFQAATLHGQYRDTSFALDGTYRQERGDRPDAKLRQRGLDLKIKAQLTPQDLVFVQSSYSDANLGDVSAVYDPTQALRGLRVKETQEPILLAGYHHTWSPGHHTLLLAGRLDDSVTVTNPSQGTLWIVRDSGGRVNDAGTVSLTQDYRSDLEIYLAELQQIGTVGSWTWMGGMRFQTGEFGSRNASSVIPFNFPPITSSSFRGLAQTGDNDFERFSTYAYASRELLDNLSLTAGLSYDRLIYPENHRFAPLSAGQNGTDRFSPKAGLVWQPADTTTLRAAFTRSLGGASLDQSYQLEPAQVAGFQQLFRSIIPESVAAANAAARFESFGLAWDQSFGRATYLIVSGEILNSQVSRSLGVLDLTGAPPWRPGQLGQDLDYQERLLSVALNQLLGDAWSVGVRYQMTESDLEQAVPDALSRSLDVQTEATLHQLRGFAIFTHPSGWFSQVDSVLSAQSNGGADARLEGDTFWQFNLQTGYRFWRRKVEARVGILNLTDQDYRLNPLNLTARLPRDRTFVASFRVNF